MSRPPKTILPRGDGRTIDLRRPKSVDRLKWVRRHTGQSGREYVLLLWRGSYRAIEITSGWAKEVVAKFALLDGARKTGTRTRPGGA